MSAQTDPPIAKPPLIAPPHYKASSTKSILVKSFDIQAIFNQAGSTSIELLMSDKTTNLGL